MDGAVLIVKAGSTAREVTKRAADILSSSQINLLGVVLNNVKGSLPYYYDYRHYNYDYSQRRQDGKPLDNRKRPGTTIPDETGYDKAEKTDREAGLSGKKRLPK